MLEDDKILVNAVEIDALKKFCKICRKHRILNNRIRNTINGQDTITLYKKKQLVSLMCLCKTNVQQQDRNKLNTISKKKKKIKTEKNRKKKGFKKH